MRPRLALLAALLTAVGLFLTTAPLAAAPEPPADPRTRFALDVLRGIGNDTPSQAIVDFMIEWTIAEDAGPGALVRNNPLNTTQTSGAVTQTINGDGVRGYASYEDGLAATLQTLSYGYYIGIVAALRANDPDAARQALWASPWAASHYGWGASWPRRGT